MSGWTRRNFASLSGAFCYLFVSEAKSWPSAIAHCTKQSFSVQSATAGLFDSISLPRLLYFLNGDFQSELSFLTSSSASRMLLAKSEVWTSAVHGGPVCETNLTAYDYWADGSPFVYLGSDRAAWALRSTLCPLLVQDSIVASGYRWSTANPDATASDAASLFCWTTNNVTVVPCAGMLNSHRVRLFGKNKSCFSTEASLNCDSLKRHIC